MEEQQLNKLKEVISSMCGDKYTTEWENLNYIKIPKTVINAELGSEKQFNELYQLLLNSDFKPIVRTKSGGISIAKSVQLFNHYNYDVRNLSGCTEIVISLFWDDEMRTFRIQYRGANYKDKDTEKLVSGRESFNTFKRELAKDGIDIEDYAVSTDVGIQYNKRITPPDAQLQNVFFANRVFENVHHLDFHKFYISGVAIAYPEFRPTIERLAEKAKTNSKYKTILAATTGYMHSKACGYKYAKIAMNGINTAYKRFYEVFDELKKDHLIISTNTDGIWYTGNEFHGVYEGDGITYWNNDHLNTKFRAKSGGAYEFIENGKYTPVVKGRTLLDAVKNRKDWKWGDIYNYLAAQQVYKFEKGVGIVWLELK